jgi:LacI family transcriptional regulator
MKRPVRPDFPFFLTMQPNEQRERTPRRVAICLDVDWRIRRELDVFAGCQSYADKAGWLCTIEPALARTLNEEPGGTLYDGIVGRITPAIAAAARAAGLPVVNTWLNSPVTDVALVNHDWKESGVMAARHLLGRGFRRFGYLGCWTFVNARRQLQGFRSALEVEGFRCTDYFYKRDYADWNSRGWKAFIDGLHAWLGRQQTPLGILADDDLPCRFLIDVCRNKGLHVPGDVSIVGTGNETVICNAPQPSLTSIDLGHFQKGYRAAELLDRLMDGETPPAGPELLPPAELVLRQSTDAFAVNDPLVARAWRFLAENSDRRLRVAEVATEVAVSRRTLEQRFHAAVGRSLVEEMIRLRVNRAMRRLVENDEPIKAVALATGFSSANYFSKVFAGVVGVSPTRFRDERRAVPAAR